jgi:hypothetical protein
METAPQLFDDLKSLSTRDSGNTKTGAGLEG